MIRASSGSSLSAMKMKKIITSSGIARKNSTTSVLAQRSTRWSDSRPAAKTTPKTSEASAAQPKALRVFASPFSSSRWMPS